MSEDNIFKRIKEPLYGFVLGLGVSIGGQKLMAYVKSIYESQMESSIEMLSERILEKYKEMKLDNERA